VGELAAINITKGLDLSRLVEELAANLRPSLEIWNDHGIFDLTVAEKLLSLPVVQEMYTEAKARWHSKTNIRERIKSKSLVVIEQSIADLAEEAVNTQRPLNHRVEAWKVLTRWAGLDAEAAQAAGAGGVNITIDLSGGVPQVAVGDGPGIVVIEGEPPTEEEEDELTEVLDEIAEMDPFDGLDIDADIDALGAGIDMDALDAAE
jgi:hypothetical protein